MSQTRAELCKVFFISLVLYSATWQLPLFGLIIQKFFLKKILIFFRKNLPWKSFLYFLQKSFFYFPGSGTFLYFLKKGFSYISRKVYSEPWHIQNIGNICAMEYFAKNSYLEHNLSPSLKTKISHLKNVLMFSYNSGNENLQV